MRLSYENVLVLGPYPKIRAVLAKNRWRAVVAELGPDRWAVVPEVRHGVSSAAFVASLISEATGGLGASFRVYEPELLAITVYTGGSAVHSYYSEQGHTVTNWDENDEPFLIDQLGRAYAVDEPRPHGPYGADPAPFIALADGSPVDTAGLAAVLNGSADATARHHEVLRHLGLDVPVLRMTCTEAAESGVGRVTPGRLPGHGRPRRA